MFRHTPRATNRRHSTPSATVTSCPSVARTPLEPPEKLAAVPAQVVGAGTGPRERPRWAGQRPHSASAAATATSLLTAGGGESGRGARGRQRRRPGHLASARGASDAHRSVSGTSAARVRCGSAHGAADAKTGARARAGRALTHRMSEESSEDVGQVGRHIGGGVGRDERRVGVDSDLQARAEAAPMSAVGTSWAAGAHSS